MIPLHLQLITIALSLFVTLIVIMAVKKDILSIPLSFLWFGICFLMILFSLFPDLTLFLSRIMGVSLPINTLFFLTIFFLLGLSFQQNIFISKLDKRNRCLAQKIAIFESQLEKIELKHSINNER